MVKQVSFLSYQQMAETLGVSVYTVRRLVDAGDIRAINVGARRVISSDELSRISTQGVGTPRARNGR
jgi:excisionase family DNA binding protein